MADSVRDIPLHDGTTIPQLGLGVFQMSEAEAEGSVRAALAAGYRHVDTAAGYQNEAAVGRAVAASGRTDVYLTTKLPNHEQGAVSARRAFEESVAKLGVAVPDLYLIHWPDPSRGLFVESWRTLVALREEGRVRSIGVSNFQPHHLRRIVDDSGVVPVINQVELHPYFQQREVRAANRELGIVTEAWAPLGQGRTEELADPVVVRIAAEHGVTPAQVVIAWHLAIGNVVFPKSVTDSRIVENLAAADVELTADDLAAIEGLDRGLRIGPDPDAFH